MREFLSLRDVRIADTSGHAVFIPASKPTRVPPALESTALALGCVPVEAGKAAPVPQRAEPLSDGFKRQKLIDACRELVALNRKEDFTKSNVPRKPAVEALVDFTFTVEELAAAWDAIQSAED